MTLLSIVIPVYNEEETLPILIERLEKSLNDISLEYEILFINDGSKDRSLEILKKTFNRLSDYVRIIDFQGNYGQHMAIMAAFEKAKGDVVITLDADLQNPPEEIYKLLQKIEEGHDYVGSYRKARQDTFFRTYISKLVNWGRKKMTDIVMKDHGCMLRAYSRRIVDLIIASQECSTFIPALAYKYAMNPTEIEVNHESRFAGTSKYNLYRLIRLNFDLITSFSLVPLQAFTLFGIVVSALSGLLVFYMVLRRLIVGPEAQGLFTLFAIIIFLISVAITGIGLVGEYLGRIFQTLSNRPRYMIRKVIEKETK